MSLQNQVLWVMMTLAFANRVMGAMYDEDTFQMRTSSWNLDGREEEQIVSTAFSITICDC